MLLQQRSNQFPNLAHRLSCFSCVWLLRPYGLKPIRLPVHGILQTRILEWGGHFLLQGIFLTQGLNLPLLCLLPWQMSSLPQHHLKSIKSLFFTWVTDLCLGTLWWQVDHNWRGRGRINRFDLPSRLHSRQALTQQRGGRISVHSCSLIKHEIRTHLL